MKEAILGDEYEIMHIGSTYANARFYLGSAYYNKDELNKATSWLQKALELDPNYEKVSKLYQEILKK